MYNIIKWLYGGILLFIFAAHYTCKVKHLEIVNEIKSYADNGSVIDGFFKPDRMLGEGYCGSVWKGIKFFFLRFS